jgi:hypothetical protein
VIPDPDPEDPSPELLGYVLMCAGLALFIVVWTLTKVVG